MTDPVEPPASAESRPSAEAAARAEAGAPARRRRRAVGPPGARPSQEPDLRLDPLPTPSGGDDDERLRREVPPHHGG